MRKRIFGRRLKRDTNERKALFRSLMHGLVLQGKIRTTEAKAKSIKGEVEKLVTTAKNKGEEAKGLILSKIANEKVTEKIIKEIAPLFSTRPGGYTRIMRLGARDKDGAKMVLLSWVEEVSITSVSLEKRNKTKKENKTSTTESSAKTPKKEKAAAKSNEKPKSIPIKSGSKGKKGSK